MQRSCNLKLLKFAGGLDLELSVECLKELHRSLDKAGMFGSSSLQRLLDHSLNTCAFWKC